MIGDNLEATTRNGKRLLIARDAANALLAQKTIEDAIACERDYGSAACPFCRRIESAIDRARTHTSPCLWSGLLRQEILNAYRRT